jgi:large subunit ribosomal protein L17
MKKPTKKWRKLSRIPQHRKMMMRNMATSLFLHEKITTTLPKAMDLKRFVDRLISRSRTKDLSARRYVSSMIHDTQVQKKIFDVLHPRYATRVGGYTQVFKMGRRMSDSAPIALIRLMV